MDYRSYHCGSVVRNPTNIHEDAVQSLVTFSGLRMRCCCELWHRSQTWLRSGIALTVAQASSYSSDSTNCLENSICCGCGPKKTKKKKKRKREITNNLSPTCLKNLKNALIFPAGTDAGQSYEPHITSTRSRRHISVTVDANYSSLFIPEFTLFFMLVS